MATSALSAGRHRRPCAGSARTSPAKEGRWPRLSTQLEGPMGARGSRNPKKVDHEAIGDKGKGPCRVHGTIRATEHFGIGQ